MHDLFDIPPLSPHKKPEASPDIPGPLSSWGGSPVIETALWGHRGCWGGAEPDADLPAGRSLIYEGVGGGGPLGEEDAPWQTLLRQLVIRVEKMKLDFCLSP